MSNPQAALGKYVQSVAAIKDHIEGNMAIFAAHQKLVLAQMDAENELRDAVAEAGHGVSDGRYTVNYVKQTQTFADIDELDRCVASGVIQQNHRDLIVKTQDRPPRITISAPRD